MNKVSKPEWLNSKNTTLFLIVVVITYFITNILVDSRFKEIEFSIRVQISEQQTLLSTIAEITARNGADTVTESIVRDCSVSERGQFDSLLGRLNDNLTHQQLIDLERLFGRCGSFYSDRKSVMVTKLVRETEVYESYVNQLGLITDKEVSVEYNVQEWKSLADQERKQGESFVKLVALQDRIITNLLQGYTVSSPEIVDILQEVREAKEALTFTNKKASSIRSGLVPL